MADSQLQNPGTAPASSNFPQNFQPFVFDGFDGLNTKPTRPAIENQQMFWCDNFMPLGKNNLRALSDLGSSIYTAPANDGVSYFTFGNISDTPICVAFLSSGGITQINTTTLASSTIAATGTILNSGSGTTTGVAQWGSKYILMCAPQTNGYFVWDGTLFYQAGTIGPTVTITNGGATYNSIPNMQAIGGAGSGAVFTATVASAGSISTITPTAVGSGYVAADTTVMIAFSGGGVGTSATAIASASMVGGSLAGVTVTTGGSGYSPGTVRVTISGGGGAGATATAVVGASGGPVTAVNVTNSGLGYTSAPTFIFADANNPVCQATLALMPFGIQGTAIETYTNRVWIANGAAPTTPPAKNLVVFSAPNAPADFTVTNGAGTYFDNNSFARVGYHALKQSNGFLYEIADSSVDYISGVATSGTPPTTTFTNQNIDPQVGTPWPNTAQTFSRAVVFANTFGVQALYGGAVQKVSSPLDGIYTTVTPTGTLPSYNGLEPSAAVAIVNGIHIYCLLLPIIDTYTSKQVNKILCWDGQRWFTYQPSKTLLQIATQEINSVLSAYGTDGTSIYPLFKTPSTAITKVVQSKLWDTPSYMIRKRIQHILGLFQTNDTNPDNATICVDTEIGSACAVVSNLFGATWYNNAGLIATWTNNASDVAAWQASGKTSFTQALDNEGVLVGLTLSTTAKDYTLISLMAVGQQFNVTV